MAIQRQSEESGCCSQYPQHPQLTRVSCFCSLFRRHSEHFGASTLYHRFQSCSLALQLVPAARFDDDSVTPNLTTEHARCQCPECDGLRRRCSIVCCAKIWHRKPGCIQTKPSMLRICLVVVAGLLGGARGLSLPSQRNECVKLTSSATCTRSTFVSSLLIGTSAAVSLPSPAFADEVSIAPCPKAQGSNNNCVSTASVRQLDKYMSPWTYPSSMSKEEVIARLKGAVSTNSKFQLVEQSENALRVKATRNFSVDELTFLVNPDDRVIFFASQQVDGPDAPDFGENRKRLEEIRKSIGVFGVMGEGMAYTEDPREGAFGQLKAFYGLQSGTGFESVFDD